MIDVRFVYVTLVEVFIQSFAFSPSLSRRACVLTSLCMFSTAGEEEQATSSRLSCWHARHGKNTWTDETLELYQSTE